MGKQCYLCGLDADTRDHIPPRGFFPKPWPENLLSVPCCTKCNNSYSLLDEQMRVFLASYEHANQSAKNIAQQKIFTENSVKGRPFRTVASSLKTFPIQIGNSFALGHTISATTTDLFSFVERIIRGLVYEFYPELHNPKAFIRVDSISSKEFSDAKNATLVDQVMGKLSEFAPKMKHDCFGDGVLDFLHQRANGGTGWIVSFYRGATFIAAHSLEPIPPDPNEHV